MKVPVHKEHVLALIEFKNVCKEFKTVDRGDGLINAINSIFSREYAVTQALNNVNFQIDKGELVGYLGPNGAGKSTTIKILTGVLHPTSGTVRVRGLTPQVQRKENTMHIGVVFGQRSQLFWDLPLKASLQLYRKMYKVDPELFEQNLDFYIDLLDIGQFINIPVRNLSLGQKMRANLIVSLLHNPDILYLDEPTIGLDIVAKDRMRNVIKTLNNERNITIVLTTHDMDDIEAICNRIILIDKGKVHYDAALKTFKEELSPGNVLMVELEGCEQYTVRKEFTLLKKENNKNWFGFKPDKIGNGEALQYFAKEFPIVDISLLEPSIEDILREIYSEKGKPTALSG